MSFPYAGTTGIASVLYDQCSDLFRKYFIGAVSAPANYRNLGKEVQQLSNTLEILHNYKTGGKLQAHISASLRANLDDAYKAARESIENLEKFLEDHKVIQDADSKWSKEFSSKLHYVGESKQIEIFKAQFLSHVNTLEILRSDMQQ